jgi:hypothetical protein
VDMPDSVRTAQQFLDNLFTGDFAKAEENFEASMRTALSQQSLATLWGQMTSLFGKPVRHVGTRTSKTLSKHPESVVEIVYLSWDFEKDRIDARVVVNHASKIIGLSFETPIIK